MPGVGRILVLYPACLQGPVLALRTYHSHYQSRVPPQMLFLFRFTEILLSKFKLAPNLDALIPLNRAKSYNPNNPTFNFIPILEGEIQNLLVLCLHTFAG